MKVLFVDCRVEELGFACVVMHSLDVLNVLMNKEKRMFLELFFDVKICIEQDFDFVNKLKVLIDAYFLNTPKKSDAIALEGSIKNLLNLAVDAGKLHTGTEYDDFKNVPGIVLLSNENFDDAVRFCNREGT